MDQPCWVNQRTRLDGLHFEPCELEAVVGLLQVSFWLDGKEAVGATAPIQLSDYADPAKQQLIIEKLRADLQAPANAAVHEHWLTPMVRENENPTTILWDIAYRVRNGQLEKHVSL